MIYTRKQQRATSVILSLLLGVLSGKLFADAQQELKRAQKALENGAYQEAFESYSKIHHPVAYFTVAFMFDEGLGRPANESAACDWYSKAAEAEVPAGAFRYSNCLAQGIGHPADVSAAAIWYERAAGLGYYEAYCSLGRLYMLGRGVEKDVKKAVELCQQAASHGSPWAMLQLGRWYYAGDEEIRDLASALLWFQRGAERNVPEAQHYLGMMILDGLVKEREPAQSLEWLERAASQGYRPSYLPVAVLYWTRDPDPETGQPVAANLAKTYLWASAARRTAESKEAHDGAKELLAKVIALMPEEWKAHLDAEVDEHLAIHHE